MVLIEMHLSNPSGRSQYIWNHPQKWPVPEVEDGYVTRIEAFAYELTVMKKNSAILKGRQTGVDGGSGEVMDWRLTDAESVSRTMRRAYGSDSK